MDEELPKDEASARWIGCPLEEHYVKGSRKEGKKARKAAEKRDRSKYKKTDSDKYLASLYEKQSSLQGGEQIRGRVLSIMPQEILVDTEFGLLRCVLKGILKKERTHAKNLVAVGDFVLLEMGSEGEGTIAQILPRRSVLSRADNLSRRKEQLIAVNIDQVLITTSVVDPPIKPSLIDRYIIATQKGSMDPVVVINKVDLLRDARQGKEFEEMAIYEELKATYATLNIPVVGVSSRTGEGMEELLKLMHGKASVFSGQSGVGKTSLINLVSGLEMKVAATVHKTGKGSHTTTQTQLIPLSCGGWVVDTPGIKSFGVWNLASGEIERYFDELHEIGRFCKFPDCSHTHEADCAVLQALEEGKISPIRYDSYLALIASLEQDHMRR